MDRTVTCNPFEGEQDINTTHLQQPSIELSKMNLSSNATTRSRNLVILMDGTANEYCRTNTNIIKLASLLQVDDDQLMYYDSGIGTTLPAAASTWSDLRRDAGVALDEMLAWDFSEHVQSAYRYIMDTYQDGDKIYIFGFSRGSYSARTLAGMIEKVGLLPAGNHSQIPIAYKIYKQHGDSTSTSSNTSSSSVYHSHEPLARGYKRTFGISKQVRVHFLGVYDTVASLGVIEVKELPFASSVGAVRYFRQALALNERRAKFQPVYHHPDAAGKNLRAQHPIDHQEQSPSAWRSSVEHGIKGVFGRLTEPPERNLGKIEREGQEGDRSNSERLDMRSKEVWFLGCHSDVGGGNDENGLPSLSNISFRWMLREAEQHGLKLDPTNLFLHPALNVPPITQHVLGSPALKTLVDKIKMDLLEDVISLDEEYGIRQQIKNLTTSETMHRLIQASAAFDTDPETFRPDQLWQTNGDLSRPITESLTFRWWLFEFWILQTRKYGGGAGGTGHHGDYSWRINLFRYRKMLPGHLQSLHRSVQRKLQYDQYHMEKKTKGFTPWEQPVDLLPPDWKVTWDQLRDGVAPNGVDVWEN